MRVKRQVSTNAEIKQNIKKTKTYAEDWALRFQASDEKDMKCYNEMLKYLQIEKEYNIRLEKRELTKKEKLFSFYQDILKIKHSYHPKYFFCNSIKLNEERLQSLNRLIQFTKTTFANNKLSDDKKFNTIAAFLLNELNMTENLHNKNIISSELTTSRLAQQYMAIFEEYGINPEADYLNKMANEFPREDERENTTCYFRLPRLELF